jgi:protein TonB
MRDTLPFLVRLQLDTDTDSRSIRRAYARELKLIDQEQDAAGFQELREAYDSALQWLAWRDQQAAAEPEQEAEPEPAAEPAPAPNYGPPRTPVTLGPAAPAVQLDDPQQLAAAVFAEFHAAISALLQQQHVQHAAQWQQALQHCLDDERLLNITARIYFEAHIAHLLAGGWQPGHEVLFVVAGKLFHWGEDRRRLQQLGRAGALIDKAIDERSIFDRLPEAELMIHRAAITLLRKDDPPSDYQLRGDMPNVEKLMAYFPVWMSMMVNLNVVEQWRASYQALPPPKKSWWPKFDIGISPRVGWVAVHRADPGGAGDLQPCRRIGAQRAAHARAEPECADQHHAGIHAAVGGNAAPGRRPHSGVSVRVRLRPAPGGIQRRPR